MKKKFAQEEIGGIFILIDEMKNSKAYCNIIIVPTLLYR